MALATLVLIAWTFGRSESILQGARHYCIGPANVFSISLIILSPDSFFIMSNRYPPCFHGLGVLQSFSVAATFYAFEADRSRYTLRV
jgi:hypothetical protein